MRFIPAVPSTKDKEKAAKVKAKEEADRKARVKAHHRTLAKKGSGARWKF